MEQPDRLHRWTGNAHLSTGVVSDDVGITKGVLAEVGLPDSQLSGNELAGCTRTTCTDESLGGRV